MPKRKKKGEGANKTLHEVVIPGYDKTVFLDRREAEKDNSKALK